MFKFNCQNNGVIRGKLTELSGIMENNGDKYQFATLEAVRKSGKADKVHVMVPEKYFERMDLEGVEYDYYGHIESYSQNRVTDLNFVVDDIRKGFDSTLNSITLEGWVGKINPVRTTNKGRNVRSVILAVNSHGRSNYIPVVLWGEDATNPDLIVGRHMIATGRYSTREYRHFFKEDRNGDFVYKTAYEIAIAKVEVLDDKSPSEV